LSGLARGQATFPSKPIRLIVTSPSGGSNDILNRTLAANTPEEFAYRMREDARKLARVIRESGAKTE